MAISYFVVNVQHYNNKIVATHTLPTFNQNKTIRQKRCYREQNKKYFKLIVNHLLTLIFSVLN